MEKVVGGQSKAQKDVQQKKTVQDSSQKDVSEKLLIPVQNANAPPSVINHESCESLKTSYRESEDEQNKEDDKVEIENVKPEKEVKL